LEHLQKLFATHGSDCWWTMDEKDLLPEKYREDANKWKKGTDTMDVWFDSGSSWAGVAQTRQELAYPADIYLEGSDQHRGWFQSSLLTSVANNKMAPYKTVLTHGFVLDEKGFKMSKSLGNVVDPMKVIDGGSNKKTEPAYGADVLRLWVANSDYSGDVSIGDNIIKQTFESYRKLRNTARYLIGNLADFVPEGREKSTAVSYEDLPSMDRWMLGQLSSVLKTVDEAIDQFQFQRAIQEIIRFAAADLSNFYLDVAKDRLYISAIDDKRRRSCQTVIHACLEGFAKSIAPLLPHMAEDIWQNLPYEASTKSVFEGGWPRHLMNFPPTDTKEWDLILNVRDDVNKMLEVARADKLLGASLEAAAFLYFVDDEKKDILQKFVGDTDLIHPPVKANGVDELRTALMLSEVHIMDSENDIATMCDTKYISNSPTLSGCVIGIRKASGQKCGRCWFYDNQVGKHDLPHSDVCQRCNDAIVAWEKETGYIFVRPTTEKEVVIEPVA
jgi:isoleucyl-tRNA synthetase